MCLWLDRFHMSYDCASLEDVWRSNEIVQATKTGAAKQEGFSRQYLCCDAKNCRDNDKTRATDEKRVEDKQQAEIEGRIPEKYLWCPISHGFHH